MSVVVNCDVCGAAGAKRISVRVHSNWPAGFRGPSSATRDLCPQHSEEAGQLLTQLWEAIGVAPNETATR